MKYETEIHGSWLEDNVNADIKYPCGEIIESWSCDSFVEAGKKITDWLEANPYSKHQDCSSEYCC